MSGLNWYKAGDFPMDYDGLVIVKYDSSDRNCYGTYPFYPGKGIWTCTDKKITHIAAINEPGVEK